MEVNKKEVGTRIKSIRISLGLTTQEFAQGFLQSASKGTVSKWENGHYLPNNQRIKEIASFGGITVDELLYGKETNGKTYDGVYFTDDEVEIINLLRANETPLNEFIERQEEYIASLEDSLNRIAIAHQDIRVSCGDVKDNIIRTFWNKSLTLDEIKATHGE